MRDRQYIIGLKKAIEYVDSTSDEALLNIGWSVIPLVMLKEKGKRIYFRKGNPMSTSRDVDDYIVQLCFSQTDKKGRLVGVFFDSKFRCGHLDWVRSWEKERLQYLLNESERFFLLGYDQTGWTRFERKYDSFRTIEALIEMGETGFNQRLSFPARQVYRVIMKEEDGLWDPEHYYGDFYFGLRLSDKALEFEKWRMTVESISFMNGKLKDEIVKTQRD